MKTIYLFSIILALTMLGHSSGANTLSDARLALAYDRMSGINFSSTPNEAEIKLINAYQEALTHWLVQDARENPLTNNKSEEIVSINLAQKLQMPIIKCVLFLDRLSR